MTLPGALTQVRSGKLVMLGVLSDKRVAAAADLPTVNESQAIKGVTVEIWAALAGPPKLPTAVVERLSKAVQELLNDKDFTERRAKQGDVAPPWASPAEFGRFLAAEDERYRQLATGLKLE